MSQSLPHLAKAKSSAIPPPLPQSTQRGKSTRSSPPPLKKKPPTSKKKISILNPAELDPFKDLLLFAQLVVEGWFAGKHHSLDYGSSAEFAEYKHYSVGDPISQIDWKVYARSRELVIRKNREEKDMTGYLMVDISASMSYQSGNREPKLARAVRIAAALAYLMRQQGDKSSLACFHTEIKNYVPPGSTQAHIFDLVKNLESVFQKGAGQTKAHSALDLCIPLFKKRGSLIVISDFLTDRKRLFDALAQFQHRRFHILLLHVVDPDEMHLPNVSLTRFIDLESRQTIQVDPDEIRQAYRADCERDQQELEDECLQRGIEYRFLDTAQPWVTALEAWLGMRGAKK